MWEVKRFYKKMMGMLLIGVIFAVSGVSSAMVMAAETDLTQYGMLPIYGNDIADGEYSIDVKTSDEALGFREAKLTVSGGKMKAELTVGNIDYTRLYLGDTRNASKEKAAFEEDGYPVYEVPVEALDRTISCSVYDAGKEEWNEYGILFEASTLPEDALFVEIPDYDLIENAVNSYESAADEQESRELTPVTPVSVDLKDGEYSVSVDMTGGSGKAFIQSPALLIVKDGKAYARVEWSSSNYDYMRVGTEKYLNLSEEDVNSSFEIPIGCWDEDMTVIADTTAMGTPHEVEYVFTFYKNSIGSKGKLPQEAAKRVVIFAMFIIVGGGILNHVVKRRRRG